MMWAPRKVRSFQVVCHSLCKSFSSILQLHEGFTLGNLFEICISPTHPEFKKPLIVTFLPMPLSVNIKDCQIHCCIWALLMQDQAMRGKVGILCFFGPTMSCQQCRSRTGRYRSLRVCGGQAMRPLMVWKLLSIVSRGIVTFRLTPAFWLGMARRVDLSWTDSGLQHKTPLIVPKV